MLCHIVWPVVWCSVTSLWPSMYQRADTQWHPGSDVMMWYCSWHNNSSSFICWADYRVLSCYCLTLYHVIKPFLYNHYSASEHSRIFRKPCLLSETFYPLSGHPLPSLSLWLESSKQKRLNFQLQIDHETHFAYTFFLSRPPDQSKLVGNKCKKSNVWSKEEKSESHQYFNRFLFTCWWGRDSTLGLWGWQNTGHPTQVRWDWWQFIVQGRKIPHHQSSTGVVPGNRVNKQRLGWGRGEALK